MNINKTIQLAFKHHQQGNLKQAEDLYKKILKKQPDNIHVYNYLGNVLRDKGDLDEAITRYQKAIELNPTFAGSYKNLGTIFLEKGQFEEAVSYYQKAIELNPDFADAYNNLGIALIKKGQLEEAITYYQKAIEINPNFDMAYNNLGIVLVDRGQLNEAEIYFRRALQIKPDYSIAYSNLLFNVNYNSRHNPQDIFSEHLLFAKKFAEPLSSAISPHTNEREPNRRLRIGYCSPDFRRHAVACFIEPVLAAHNREHFEVFCYSDVLVADDVTRRIQGYSDHWQSIVGISDERVAESIKKDNIDVLIDLAGHTANNRMLLFARKPAPIQVSWIGYLATTGLSTIDYKIVDNSSYLRDTTVASDIEKLQLLRTSLRDRMSHSPLTDAKRFTANLEMCYYKMWERWCKSV